MGSASAGDLERRASSLRTQGRLRDAIVVYRELLDLDLLPIDRAKMLANVMQLEQELSNTPEAIRTGNEILQVLAAHDLRTNEAVFVHGVVTAALGRMRGEAPSHNGVAMLAAWVSGAALGAAVGAKAAFPWPALFGGVPLDWRHLGAVAGALLASVVFLPVLVSVGRLASFAALVVNVGVLGAVLLEGPGTAGVVTAAVVVFPILAFSGAALVMNTGRWFPGAR